MSWTRILAASCVLSVLFLPACNRAEKEREALRADLDAEFEADMAKTIEQAEALTIKIEDLMHLHEQSDKRHAELDALLEGIDLEEEDAALQVKHAEWEKKHEGLVEDARHQIERFEATRERHEVAEASHADVPLDEIREEHEQFERELEYFEGKLSQMNQDLEAAASEMAVIETEHEALKAKYGPARP